MNWAHINKNAAEFVSTHDDNALKKVIMEANERYRKGNSIISDSVYDFIVEAWENMTNKKWTVVGHNPTENKVALPIHMGSLDKIKPGTGGLIRWKKGRNSFTISDKLDGISILLEYSPNCVKPKVFTRGNGTIGCDASRIAPYVGFPAFSVKQKTFFRGELVIPKKSWSSFTNYNNPRNAVAGIVNSIVRTGEMSDETLYLLMQMHFVVFDTIVFGKKMTKREELREARLHGFRTVKNVEQKDVDEDGLTAYLKKRRSESSYDIDGIVVSCKGRNDMYPEKGNPSFAIAFKTNLADQIAKTVVTGIEWTTTKHSIFKPVVLIESVHINGSKISRVYAHNAKFLHEKGINKGAIIQIIMSGDIIPKILKVIHPKSDPSFPSSNWKWVSDVDIGLLKTTNDVLVKQITAFASKLGIVGLKNGTARKLVKSGICSIADVCSINLDKLLSIEGFKETSATKLYNSIQDKFNAASNLELLAALNAFGPGFSTKKLKPVMETYPDLPMCNVDKDRMIKMPGWAEKSVVKFIKMLPKARELFESLPSRQFREKQEFSEENSKLKGLRIVFSGFRDKDLSSCLERMGAIVDSAVTKNTDFVVAADPEKQTSKIKKANKYNIKILSKVGLKDNFF